MNALKRKINTFHQICSAKQNILRTRALPFHYWFQSYIHFLVANKIASTRTTSKLKNVKLTVNVSNHGRVEVLAKKVLKVCHHAALILLHGVADRLQVTHSVLTTLVLKASLLWHLFYAALQGVFIWSIFELIAIAFLYIDRSASAGKSYWRGRLSTVGLLVLTSLDQLILILQTLFTFLQNKIS